VKSSRRILIIGGGGREHCLAWKIRQSRRLGELFCTPGNAGIREIALTFDCPLTPPYEELIRRIRNHEIDYTVIGPEGPLAAGIADYLEAAGLKVFGPIREAARLESSKAYAKDFMREARIPTAESATFTDSAEAIRFARKLHAPMVIKADGLAAGKGVVVARTVAEAENAIRQNLESRQFGDASSRVVVEEFLEGEEASILALMDGNVLVPLASAQDHKTLHDNDLGPNTGGMGAYSPAPIITEELTLEINETIFQPLQEQLQKQGISYRGVIYAGIMLTEEGPKVLEFNCRFGDPETQAILPRLENDLIDIIEAVCEGTLHEHKLQWSDEAAICVVMAARGYPDSPQIGGVITGLDELKYCEQAVVFHGGTAHNGGDIIVNGGRVLGVTALGRSLPRAMDAVYRAVQQVQFDGAQYRRDIGRKALAYL
jgi:phosphoribosylamine--glycine ligase